MMAGAPRTPDLMRRAILTVTMALIVSLGAPLRADDLVLARFTDYLDSLRTQIGIPGLAATVVGPGDVMYEHAFGLRDIDRNDAARTDTPFHLDGLTQLVVASLAMRCAESGWISLDDPISKYATGTPDDSATLRQLLSHTSAGPNGLVFAYRLDRLAPLAAAVSVCTDSSFRYGVAALLDRLAMIETVPGPDVVLSPPPADGLIGAVPRYTAVMNRLAVPYAVDARGNATRSRYPATTLTPSGGLISTVRDLAQFDLALKKGVLVRAETLAAAWTPPVDRSGNRLPHGLGWFIQTYNGEKIVWQFGQGDSASSSLMLTVPARGLTLILAANSDGLAKSFNLAAGDVTISPFARVFLGIFVR
jgi:CubicO group peptidase (beta-lactamase class C family)